MPFALKQLHGASLQQPQALQTMHVCHSASPVVSVDLRLATGMLHLGEMFILHQAGVDVALWCGKEGCWMELLTRKSAVTVPATGSSTCYHSNKPP